MKFLYSFKTYTIHWALHYLTKNGFLLWPRIICSKKKISQCSVTRHFHCMCLNSRCSPDPLTLYIALYLPMCFIIAYNLVVFVLVVRVILSRNTIGESTGMIRFSRHRRIMKINLQHQMAYIWHRVHILIKRSALMSVLRDNIFKTWPLIVWKYRNQPARNYNEKCFYLEWVLISAVFSDENPWISIIVLSDYDCPLTHSRLTPFPWYPECL